MKTQLMIIVFLLIANSCVSQRKETISKSTIKLEGRNTSIRNLIEIDGYYQNIDSEGRASYGIFFEDGVCGGFWFKEGVTEEMKRKNLSEAIDSWMQKGQVRWGSYWGVYKIDKDTIVIQTVNKAGIFDWNWSFSELKYEIIDRQTLKLIYQKSLINETEYDKYPYEIRKRNIIDKFVPADSLPSSDNWLKEEKWIWRNEQDWKDYMERIKQKNKKGLK